MRFGIISAGEGSRLASEGFSQPKPLVPICGVPMIERLVRIMQSCGADKIAVIVNGRDPETVSLLKGLPVDLVVKKTPTPMHSLMELAPCLEGDRFCVTTVDTVFSESRFRTMMDEFSRSPLDGLMGVTSLIDDEKPLYVSTDESLRITGFLDSCDAPKYISGGIYGLTPASIDTLRRCIERGESRMRNFQRALVRDGLRLQAFPFSKVLDIDHASDIAKAERFLKD